MVQTLKIDSISLLVMQTVLSMKDVNDAQTRTMNDRPGGITRLGSEWSGHRHTSAMLSEGPSLSVFTGSDDDGTRRPRSGESTGHPKTHPNTGMIQHWAVMERERRGDAGWSAEHNATRGNFDHGEKRSEDKDNEKTTISHMSRARQQVTTPAATRPPCHSAVSRG